MTSIPLKPLPTGAHYIILSKEMIQILRELHEDYRQLLFNNRHKLLLDGHDKVKTLERILKQID